MDDEPALLRAYRRRLRQWTNIDYVESSAEASALLQSSSYKLILTDFNMPGLDGLALLTQAQSSSPQAKRFLMTGAPNDERVMEAVRDGVIHRCLPKPFKANMLVTLLENEIPVSEQ